MQTFMLQREFSDEKEEQYIVMTEAKPNQFVIWTKTIPYTVFSLLSDKGYFPFIREVQNILAADAQKVADLARAMGWEPYQYYNQEFGLRLIFAPFELPPEEMVIPGSFVKSGREEEYDGTQG